MSSAFFASLLPERGLILAWALLGRPNRMGMALNLRVDACSAAETSGTPAIALAGALGAASRFLPMAFSMELTTVCLRACVSESISRTRREMVFSTSLLLVGGGIG